MRIILWLILVAAVSSGCKSKQNGVSTSATQPAPAAPSETSDEVQAKKDALNNIVISFYSIGAGVNTRAVESIEKFIGEYSTKTGKSIPYSKVAWGREGEVDFCISLVELQGEQKRIFVQETRRLARQYEQVNFYEDHPCRELK